MYKDEINYYYIFKTLKSLFIDLKRKSKNIKMISIDDPQSHIKAELNLDCENQVNFKETNDRIENALSKMYWYDRKVFEIINSGESIADFSRNSNIKYYSLYWTYNKVKEQLKKLL
jgi:DNA-directed RNA polymerase specialized sigma24 family protein